MKRFLLSILFFVGVVSLGVGQVDGDFRTRQTGQWNDPNTWERFDGAVWVSPAPSAPTSADGAISIRANHTASIINGETVVADQLSVLSNGILNINSGGILSLNNGTGNDLSITAASGGRFGTPRGLVNVFGTLTVNQGATLTNTISNLLMKSGGVYNLNYSTSQGTIPTLTWVTGSTVSITGNTTNTSVPNGLNQTFYNFLWDTPTSGLFIMDLNFQPIVTNNFTVESTGSTFLAFSQSATANYTIGGDLTLNNSSLVDFDYDGTITINIGGDLNINDNASLGMAYIANTTLNVSGDLNLNGGRIDIDADEFGGSPNGNGIINVQADFTANGGDFIRSGNGTAQINFNGSGAIDFTNESSVDIDYSFATNSNYNITAGALGGPGDLTIGDNVILGISSADGISSGISVGNIQVGGTRTYGNNPTFIYNGSGNQVLGNGLPSVDYSLEINNGSQVSLSGSTTIALGQTLTLTTGVLDIGPYLLTSNGSIDVTSGAISGGSTSNLTLGGTGPLGVVPFSGTNELNNLTINRSDAGGNNVEIGNDLIINGILDVTQGDLILGGILSTAGAGSIDQSGGTISLNGNQLIISGDFTQTGGEISSTAASSLIVNGSGSLPTSLSFTGDINTITLNRTGATLNTAASGFTATNLNLYSGTLDGTAISIANGGRLERRTNGVLTNAVTAVGSYNLIYDHTTALSTGAELPISATAINNIEKRGTGVLTVQNNFTANGSLTFTGGSFNAGANTISLNGDLIANAASTLSNSTITFDGTTNLTGSNNPTFGSITVNGTFNPASSLTVNGDITNNGVLNSSAGTLTINATSQLGGSNPINVNNFTIGASGNVTASAAQALEIDGNFTNNGSFAANGGTVIFGGNTTISGTVPDFASIQVDGIFNAPSTLNLSGSLTNNGTFNDGDGIINMTGASARSIAGTSGFNIHTLNLDGSTVSNNNTGGVSIENGITLAANTTFDADGGGSGLTTLLSTSSTDAAYVGQIPSTSSVTGNITVQRFFSTGRFWRYLGSPVTNATVADWQQEFAITGTFSDPSTGSFDGTTLNSSSVSLYYYDAAGSAYVAYPSSGTAASNSIVNGRGYSPFIRNSTANVIGAVTGTLQQQGATLPVAFNGDPAESWNLVANPYAAPIDWDAAGWTKTNVLNEVHIPLVSSGGFATYIGGVSANGGSRYIASGQAFWVRTDATSPELTAVEAVKSVNENPTYFRTDPVEVFRIKMMHANLSDEIVFALRDEATFGYDDEFDANRRLNINGFGYTLSTTGVDDRKLKINSIPKLVDSDCSVAIPINMESVTKTGDFTLSFSEVSNLLNYYKVDFIDNYTNEVIAVSTDFQYSYKINSEAASKAVDRFSLLLNNSGVGSLTNLKDVDACVSSEVSYPLENLNPNYSYSVFSGEVKITEISNQTEAVFSIPDSLLQNTVNGFDVYGQAGTCDSAKVGTFTVSTTDSNINLDLKVLGSTICPDATEGSFELTTETGVEYFILDDTDTIQSIKGDGNLFTGTIESKYLNPGKNAFLIYAEKNECAYGSLNQQLEIDVTDLEIDQTIVFNSKNTCLNSPADINFVSQSGVDYEIYKGTTLVKSVTGEGTEETIQISESSLTTGLNEFTVLARYGSCAEFEFPEPVQIEVEESINTDLNLLTKNTCGNTNAAVIIKNAQADKVYTLQSAGEDISSLTAATDGLLEFSLNADQVSIGVNELDIKIEGKNCGAILSANKAIFTVNESINPDLNIEATDVCTGGQISIEIVNPQVGKTYNLLRSEDIVATEVASSEEVLLFNLPSSEFGTGAHSLNVDIVDNICGTVAANQTVEFEVFDAAVIAAVENQNVCKNESVVIDLSANVAMSSYQLYVGEELISEVSSSTVTLSPEETTTYTLTGISENGCGVNTVNFTVEVTDLAKPGILVSNNVLESSVEGESYQWYLNSEKLVNEQGKVLVAQESGDYSVEVSKANCTEMSDVYTFSEEVLNANRALAESLHLYPNPVQDILYLEFESLDELEVKIYTLSGRFMDQMNLNSDKNQTIDMSKFAEGTYLIQLTSGKGSITKRIIKK